MGEPFEPAFPNSSAHNPSIASFFPSSSPDTSRGRSLWSMFLLVGLVLVLLLPSPWNVVALLACLTLFFGELAFWNRTVRGHRKRVGAETLIGRGATVVTACQPSGQVRLGGETWHARCDQGAAPGDAVVVRARDGLTLIVERA
jgi:membrane protein implicated in regulation of membrane protease activity